MMEKKYSSKELADIIQGMDLNAKVGQLFLLAYPGKDPKRISRLIAQYGISGCYISQDNAESFEEAQRISEDLQHMALNTSKGIPLFLGVDQEGAWGVLIPESHPGPGNLALGTLHDCQKIREMYRIFGTEMMSVGYNTLLAPCADVNLNPLSPIIGTRSFGEDPARVADCVVAALQGATETGILTTLKHFPGHGATEQDTHRELPLLNRSLDELLNTDLLPFIAGIKAGADIVMTSHIVYPQIDKEYPATLSPIILNDILRKTLHFKGIILSDSMNMGAIRKSYDPAESTLLALRAGVDIVMLSEEHYDHDALYLEKQLQSMEKVKTAIQDGQLPESEVDKKLMRILDLKFNKMQLRGKALASAQRADFGAYEIELATACIQSTKFPQFSSTQRILCLNASPRSSYRTLMNARGIGPNQETPAFDSFRETLMELTNAVVFFSFEELSLPLVQRQIADAEALIIVTEDYPLPGEDFDKTEQQALIQSLLSNYAEKISIVGLRSAYEQHDYPQHVPYLSSLSSRNCAAIAAAKFLKSRISHKHL